MVNVVAIKISPELIQARGNQFARFLTQQDIPERGVIACLLPNCAEFAYVMRGITWCGRLLVPINWHLSSADIVYIIQNSETDAILIHSNFSNKADEISHSIPSAFRFSVGGHIDGFLPYENSLNLPDHELDNPIVGNVMIYTSGTTGQPKGVQRQGAMMDGRPPCFHGLAGKAMLQRYLKEKSGGTHIVVAPYYHSAPLTYGEGASLLGFDLVIMEKWDGEEFLKLVQEYRATSVFMVPTHFVQLLQLPEDCLLYTSDAADE